MAEAKLCVIAVFVINFHPAVVDGTACKFREDQTDLCEDNDSFENGPDLPTLENTPIPLKKYPFLKKWQVGRVSRKQYEIINMLWRRPNSNTGVNIETTTTSMTVMRKQNSLTTDSRQYVFSVPQSFPFARYVRSTSSTPSYIEFYYLDEFETGDHTGSSTTKKKKDVRQIKLPHLNEDQNRYVIRPPLLAFNLNEPTYIKPVSKHFLHDSVFQGRPTLLPKQNGYVPNKIQPKRRATFTMKTYDINKISPSTISSTTTKPVTISSTTTTIKTLFTRYLLSTVIPVAVTKNHKHEKDVNTVRRTLFNVTKGSPENSQYVTETTLYDKIKFFEVYDSDTHSWLNRDIPNLDNAISNSERIKLEHIYDSMSEKLHLNMKFLKKDVGNSQNEIKRNCSATDSNCLNKEFVIKDKKNLLDDVTKKENESNSTVAEKNIYQNISIASRRATWAEYPFIAVYFYERLQVRLKTKYFHLYTSHAILQNLGVGQNRIINK